MSLVKVAERLAEVRRLVAVTRERRVEEDHHHHARTARPADALADAVEKLTEAVAALAASR